MRKILTIPMTLLLVSSLVGCGTNNKDDQKDNVNTSTDSEVNKETTTEGTTTNDVNQTSDHKLELADDVADKITKLEEVESANVIVTDNNAYVGVMLKEGVSSTEELDKKIADEARATNANFANVYVSTNPDFAKQFTEYGEKIRANEPVEGFFEEFSDTVKRVFPDAH
ncbi:YhcN/YlaJ family sporulation lipoprotein [Psychrobacillus sp. FSL H8-0484]|uniref:YhcN/YlaJ family sporulation lipoprotein n=1 Tax=Psychrobacillus sp. FSL H8-0484 TaxID=2921390 RepID=UPI0030FC9375